MATRNNQYWVTWRGGGGANGFPGPSDTFNAGVMLSTPGSTGDIGVVDFGTQTGASWIKWHTTGVNGFSPNTNRQSHDERYVAQGWGTNIQDGLIHDPGDTAPRVIPAGQWTFHITWIDQTVDTNQEYQEAAVVYRMNIAAQTFEYLFHAQSPLHGSLGSASDTREINITQPKFYLAVGETLHVEWWARGKGVGVFGQQRRLRRVTSGTTRFFIPGPLGYSYSASAGDVAPATDGLDEQHVATRPINETTSMSESASRELIVVRRPVDSVSGADSLEEQVHLYRATVDSLSIEESSVRSVAMTRNAEDSVVGVDAIALTYDGGRLISDSIPLTEAAKRQFDGKRSLDDTLSVSDLGERKITATRFPNETLSVGDQSERSVSLNRELSDSSPATDEVSRQVSASRPVSDAVAEGGGDIIRKSIYVFDD